MQPSVVADEQNRPALRVQYVESVKTVHRELIGMGSRFLESCLHKADFARRADWMLPPRAEGKP